MRPSNRLFVGLVMIPPMIFPSDWVKTHQEWRDTVAAKREASSLIESLHTTLLAADSATLTLDKWCEDHHLATPTKIYAEVARGAFKPLPAEVRKTLRIKPNETVGYRRVKLRCGPYVLSEADNWYLPKFLTRQANASLENTDIAFGRAVQSLQFHRQTLSSKLLWAPLSRGWEMHERNNASDDGRLEIPPDLFRHEAVLILPSGTPFSYVIETYKSDLLAFRGSQRP